jgi:hypothetical protein
MDNDKVARERAQALAESSADNAAEKVRAELEADGVDVDRFLEWLKLRVAAEAGDKIGRLKEEIGYWCAERARQHALRAIDAEGVTGPDVDALRACAPIVDAATAHLAQGAAFTAADAMRSSSPSCIATRAAAYAAALSATREED